MFVSSANKSICIFEENILGRSLIYNTNKIGPKTDPCGTPDFTIELFEKEFSTRVIRDQFDNKL